MNANILKFLAFVQEDGIEDVNENKPIISEYERLYYIYTDHYKDCYEDGEKKCEIVEGEFSNHHSHLYARSSDGTEYEMDGEIWHEGVKPGCVVGDFLDSEGKIVLVISKE